MPVFDIDDLSFFHSYGLGLRHVERERGIKESREGASRGDAVSLANYGRNDKTANDPPSLATCTNFQTEVERFILESYRNFHLPVPGDSEFNSSYNDAAFLLLDRGNDARDPYDYDSYPLGKCGTKAFSQCQVLFLITSDQYNNDDIEHAAYNTFIDLKNKIRQFKIKATQQLLDRLNSHVLDCSKVQRERIQTVLKTLIINYQNNIFIGTIIFKKIYSLLSNSPRADELNQMLSSIEKEIDEINPKIFKTNEPIYIQYQEIALDELSIPALKLKLISYIRNQNLARVKECCTRLPKNIFTDTEESPLQLAAELPNTEILRAVYEYEPEQYDILVQSKYFKSPLFLAGYCREQNNFEFLLQTKTLTKKDILFIDTHILEGSASNPSEKSYKVIKYLLDNGVDIGNELVELRKNPMSLCVRRGDYWSQQILALMLPLADYRSKYLAILSVTCELYFEYGCSKRPSNFVAEPDSRIDRLQKIRNTILCSLTSEECKQINNFSNHHSYDAHSGVEILMDDLNQELIKAQAEDKTQLVANIQSFLANVNPKLKISSLLNAIPIECGNENLLESSNDPSGNKPPHDDHKLKILLILATLKYNIRHKKNGRAVWFTKSTESKLRQLSEIETWLTNNCLDNGNESVILGQIRDVCSIKRNTLGFFQPHSLVEYKKLLIEHQLNWRVPFINN